MKEITKEDMINIGRDELKKVYLLDLDKREKNECIFNLQEGITFITGTLNEDYLIDPINESCDVVFCNMNLDGGSISSFEEFNSVTFTHLKKENNKVTDFNMFAKEYVVESTAACKNTYLVGMMEQGSIIYELRELNTKHDSKTLYGNELFKEKGRRYAKIK